MTEVPATLDNVKRVDSIGIDELIRNHLAPHTPVIVRDSQANTRISSITTEQAAADAFGDVLLQVQRNYTSPLSRNTADARRQGLSQKVRNEISEMPLRDYLRHARENPGTDLLCVEYHTPDAVSGAMRVPDLTNVPWAAEDIVSFLFVANRGNYAHLHFDGDFRNVLLYQIFGRKRVVMVPLTEQDKISPAMNFSKLLIQNMKEEEKLHLFRYLGAYDCVLNPGEAIYFPPSVWHYVEYIDTGMSVNFRFGRGAFEAKMVDANRVPFYPDLHRVLAQLSRIDDEAVRARLQEAAWSGTREVLARDFPTSRDRHRAVQEHYRDLLTATPGTGLPGQVGHDCPVAESMAVERYDAESKRWREELMLGAPL